MSFLRRALKKGEKKGKAKCRQLYRVPPCRGEKKKEHDPAAGFRGTAWQ